MLRAGTTVDLETASRSDIPMFMSLDMVIGIVARGMKKLPLCTSVEMVSGTWPCSMLGTATLNQKLPPPWPTSKSTPRFLASHT